MHLTVQEVYFYVASGDKVRNDNRTTESTSATIKDAGNQEVLEALTADDGVLGSGFQPGVRANSEAGQKALLESLNTDSKVEKTKEKKEKKEKTEKAEPTTLEESLSCC